MENALVPFQDIERMATVLGKTKMFGKSPEELLPLMLIAQAEGKHPAIAAQEYDIIQGRPAINSKSALARFQAAGGQIQWEERSDKRASATFKHPAGGTLTVTWDIARATQAGLAGKDNWRKYPAQMLSARVISEGVRAVYPVCLSGLYTDDEVRDMDPLPMRSAAIPDEPAVESAPAQAAPEPAAPAAAPDEGLKKRIREAKARFDAALGTTVDEEPVFYANDKTKAEDALHAVPDKGPKGIAITEANADYLEKLAQEWEKKLAAKMESLSLKPTKASQIAAFQDDALPDPVQMENKRSLASAVDRLSAQAKAAQTVDAVQQDIF